jgi:hypothetical protein
MNKLVVLILICFCSPLLLIAQETIKCSGVVTEWVDGKEKILSGATVVVGKQISLVVGVERNRGTDTVKGQVAAKTITDSKGFASVAIPKGVYTVIIWKQGYVPRTFTGVEAKSYEYIGSISKDTSMQGLHLTLVFEKRKSILDDLENSPKVPSSKKKP